MRGLEFSGLSCQVFNFGPILHLTSLFHITAVYTLNSDVQLAIIVVRLLFAETWLSVSGFFGLLLVSLHLV